VKKILCLLLLLFSSYSFAQVPFADPVIEMRLGRMWMKLNLKEYRLCTNKLYLDAVKRVSGRLIEAVNDRPDLRGDWSFIAVENSQVNAFSFAGGVVVIYTGLLDSITNGGKVDEDMLAGVLGHEMAHIAKRHTLSGIRNSESLNWIVQNIDSISQAVDANKLSEDQSKKLYAIAVARFSRDQEFDADKYGSFYAALAGYAYDGNLRFSELYMKLYPGASYEYLKTYEDHGAYRAPDHPSDPERIAKMRDFQKYLLSVAGEFHWGYELLRNGSYDKAIRVLKEVHALFPESFQVVNDLGIAYHLKHLQQQGAEEQKFQVQLIDYFVDLREKLREPDLLKNAIECYRDALRLNPRERGVSSNLAIALTQQRQPGDLEEAEDLITLALAKEPENPIFLNHKAIVEYTRGKSLPSFDFSEVRQLFEKAVQFQSPVAPYNLGVLDLETGRKNEATENLRLYLQHDSSSRWASYAREVLQAHGIEVPPVRTPAEIPAPLVLGLKLGDKRQEAIAHLGKPERSESVETSRQESGEMLYYDSLGIILALSQGQVIAIHVMKPDSGNNVVADLKKLNEVPEVNGLEIGASPQELTKLWGEPMQPAALDSSGSQKIYIYGDSRCRIDVSVDLIEFRVNRISIRKT